MLSTESFPPTLLPLRAESSPLGLLREEEGYQAYYPAIDLNWDIPIVTSEQSGSPEFQDPDHAFSLRILRRKGRFPGRNRRGVIPVPAGPEDLQDDVCVYDTTDFSYDFEETREDWEGNRSIAITRQYIYRLIPQAVQNPKDRILVRIIRKESERSVTSSDLIPTRMTVRFIDRGDVGLEGFQPLQAGTIYYYTAFVGPEEQRYFSRLTQASALATGHYDHALFSSLPQIHQRFDTNLPAADSVLREDCNKGQLQRFLEVFEAHADMLHGFIDGHRDLHNLQRADSRLLPHLAHLIGWKLKADSEDQQRREISLAPSVYQNVGTVRNIIAIVNGLTGWRVQVREFARSVLVSCDPDRFETIGTKTFYLDGSLTYQEGQGWSGHSEPLGSLDTDSTEAMSKVGTGAFDDPNAYSCDPDGLYNSRTIGIYLSADPDADVSVFEKTWERVKKTLTEFLPIQVRLELFVDNSPFAIAIPEEIIPVICQTLFTLEYAVVSAPFPNLITSLWEQIEGPPLLFLDPPTNRVVRVERPLTETGPFRFQVTVTDGANTFVGQVMASNIPTARALAGYKFGVSSLFEDLKIKLFLRPNHGNRAYQLNELTEAHFGWFPMRPEASDTQVLRYEVLKLNRSTGQFQLVQTVLPTEALIHKGIVGEYYQIRAYLGSYERSFFVESQIFDLFERNVPNIKNLYVDQLSQVGCKLGFLAAQEAHKTIEEIKIQGNISSAGIGTSFGFSQISQYKIIEQANKASVLDIASVGCGLGFSNIQFTKIVEGGVNP